MCVPIPRENGFYNSTPFFVHSTILYREEDWEFTLNVISQRPTFEKLKNVVGEKREKDSTLTTTQKSSIT